MKSQDKIAEIKFFDRFNREGGYDVFDKTGYQKIIKILKVEIPLKKGLLILDMGCGSGAFTSYLSKAYPNSRVIGIDISKGCVLQAKKDFPQIEFRVEDVESTKIKNGSVDLVCYSGILHHFPDFAKVAKEANRILKPNGRLFSYDPNFYNPAFWLYRSKSSPFYSSRGITKNERLLKASEIKKVFSNSSFEMKTKIISGIKFSYVESKKARPLLSVYNFVDQILAVTPLASLFGSFILGFGKKK